MPDRRKSLSNFLSRLVLISSFILPVPCDPRRPRPRLQTALAETARRGGENPDAGIGLSRSHPGRSKLEKPGDVRVSWTTARIWGRGTWIFQGRSTPARWGSSSGSRRPGRPCRGLAGLGEAELDETLPAFAPSSGAQRGLQRCCGRPLPAPLPDVRGLRAGPAPGPLRPGQC